MSKVIANGCGVPDEDYPNKREWRLTCPQRVVGEDIKNKASVRACKTCAMDYGVEAGTWGCGRRLRATKKLSQGEGQKGLGLDRENLRDIPREVIKEASQAESSADWWASLRASLPEPAPDAVDWPAWLAGGADDE
ncbi:unnamed protein product [Vitrella brassicaformis CCMP3155]|uniref:Uncharacterized protein n=2 Tax=Vitrella brassicaformis TaxID=1169539 RepID=A0A0G4GZ80_VITBC|nr:unnamed protein product [Vitrella brassicaformis CCMP3155]|eukprot:CEM36560.1 unnamed protein product [Vitrella brassicaformis CCMP3155]